MLDRVNDELSNIYQHRHKYLAVALATVIAIGVVYQDFNRRVATQELASESILHLTPRNVFVHGGLAGNNKITSLANERDAASKYGDIEQPYIPPEAEVIITPKIPDENLSDVVDIKIAKTYGFTLEPGLGLYAIIPGIGLDLKVLYYEKFGIELGGAKFFGTLGAYTPTASISYRLDAFRMLRNSELQLSYCPMGKIPASVGLRVNF
jgi:hypothetical protein